MAHFFPNEPARYFNTTGPVVAERHYCLNPLERINLEEILRLIWQQKYFVLHAPRQSGKTSCLLALTEYLNQLDAYCCVYCNMELGQPAKENAAAAIRAVLAEMALRSQEILDDSYVEDIWLDVLEKRGPETALNQVLTLWAKHVPKPLILLIDEIDALIGDSLLTFLRQLRAGYDRRPGSFPQSVVLCGVRDVQDYRMSQHFGKRFQAEISAFNIKAASLLLDNFSQEQIRALYQQHTEETQQVFEEGIFERVWQLTEGQPWLVNALAYQACFEAESDRSLPITVEAIEEAKEALILRRDTHLDQLTNKLKEPRVYRVIAPIVAGEELRQERMDRDTDDDVNYTRDLGLIARDNPLRIANAIYKEVIPRELVYNLQTLISLDKEPSWYVSKDGRLMVDKLLKSFQAFFREHSEHWIERLDYKESGPQLLLQAFLQRIVNGGGRIEREYGLGRRRTDLLVIWPIGKKEEGFSTVQKVVIELKILRKSLQKTLKESLKQTADYMDLCGTEEGHLILFDRDPERPWKEKLFQRQESCSGKAIEVWGM